MSDPGGIGLDAVSKEYRTPGGHVVRALEDVGLEVEAGRSLAITGPSGCGKSTLLGLIGGLDAPSAGRVWVGGEEISGMPERRRARLRRHELGFVFQSDNLQPFLTVLENVALALALHGAPQDGGECVGLLRRLGLANELDRLPDQLSGGQRQRVAVARALVHRPSVILADEPTGALDADNSATVIDLLQSAQAEIGATLVVVTHDPGVARRLDRAVELRDGRLVDEAVGSRAG